MNFLSDEWFKEYEALGKGVQIPAAFEGLRVNLNVIMDQGDIVESSYIDGFLTQGHCPDAATTMTAKEPLVYAAVVLGDFKSALPAYFSKKIKVEGEQAALVKLASVRSTDSQKEFYAKLKELLA